jgi:hypothetical protein
MSEYRLQKTEDRLQRTDYRGQKTDYRWQKLEFGLRPVGAIGAYAPEGSGKAASGLSEL